MRKMLEQLRLKHRQKWNQKMRNRFKLKKYIGKQCECSAQIFQYKNVYNKFPIRTQLREVKVNKIDVDHVWVVQEELYNFFLKDDFISFLADIYIYTRKNGSLAYGLSNLQEIKMIEI